MRAGPRDRRVLIESPTTARDAFGAIVPGWAAVDTVWASVIAVRGTERVAQGAQVSSAFYEVGMLYRADITEACRITEGSRVMQVRSVAEVGRRQGTKLLCEVVK